MELSNMTIADVEARGKEIEEIIHTVEDVEQLEALKTEAVALQERKKELEAIELRHAQAKELEEKTVEGTVVEERKETTEMVEKRITIDSAEYRDAFMAVMAGTATVEQRTIFADNSASGDGAALPVGLDTMIWDQITTNHPILADIDRQAFGVAIKVTQATPAGVTKKKDSDPVTEMNVTFVDVPLAGNDYLAVVKLSYAEAKMSAGAMEKYIAKAVVDQIGDAMAKDVFARILSDAAANVVTSTGSYFVDINTALGKAKMANNPVIYANNTDYYAILGEVDQNGQPIVRNGVVLGAPLKKDNAATKITIVDPAEFILDEIQSTTLKVQDSVGDGAYIYGAYARAEGCLRKTAAGAYIN